MAGEIIVGPDGVVIPVTLGLPGPPGPASINVTVINSPTAVGQILVVTDLTSNPIQAEWQTPTGVPGGGGSDITYLDNSDGTLTVFGGADNGDGTITLSGTGFDDNSDGTLTLTALES